MTKCKDCKHYQPIANWHGRCSIELPAWINNSATTMIYIRFVRADDGCDLGKEKTNAKGAMK